MNKYAKVAVQSTTTEQAQQQQKIRSPTISPSTARANLPPENHRQVLAQKKLKDAKPEGLLETVKKNGQQKKAN